MPAVEVVIPWAGECPWRSAALGWVLGRYRECWPEWSLTVAERCDKPGNIIGPNVTPDVSPQVATGARNITDKNSSPWVKADAVNPAVAASTADVIVVVDADCWCDGVGEAVDVVHARRPWAVPHTRTHRFTPDYTTRVLAGACPDNHTSVSLLERPYFGPPGGGLLVARRHVLQDVPLDPRFAGWGGEDVSWGWALQTLHGKTWRGGWPLYHLWHPPQDRPGRAVLTPANDGLRRRYYHANGRPAAMRALLDETKEATASG